MNSQQELKTEQNDNPITSTEVGEHQYKESGISNVPESFDAKRDSSVSALALKSDELNEIVFQMEKLVKLERKDLSRGLHEVGFHYDPNEETNYIVVPSWLKKSTELTAALVFKCAHLINLPVIETESETDLKTEVFGIKDNKFLTGLIISLEDKQKVTLSETKDKYELGRKVGHALRYHAELVKRKVPPSLIRKRHSWFENQPQLPGNKENPAKVYIERYLKKIIKDKRLFKLTLSLLKYTTKAIGWSHSDDALIPHMIPFAEYVRNYYRIPGFDKKEKLVNKGKGKRRKPVRPGRSNVFTSLELELIRGSMKRYWMSHKPLQAKWCKAILEGGEAYFEEVKQTLSTDFQRRWTLLEKFGNISTKRLRSLRTKLKKPNLKKRDVSTEDLSTYLTSMGVMWIEKFAWELNYLFGESWITALAEYKKIDLDSVQEAKAYLGKLLGIAYEKREKKDIITWARILRDNEANKELRVAIHNMYTTLYDLKDEDLQDVVPKPSDKPKLGDFISKAQDQ